MDQTHASVLDGSLVTKSAAAEHSHAADAALAASAEAPAQGEGEPGEQPKKVGV
jgi:hypothetical protein